jgi:serine/threonine protein phosphatase PrpC
MLHVMLVVPRFDYRLEYAVSEDRGRVRQNNEDRHLVAPEIALFAVADGMGGHNAGEIAARIALDEVREAIASERSQKVAEAYVARPDLQTRRNVFNRLRRVVERANERVRAAAAEDENNKGMGTTLDLVWLVRNYAFIAHAGDSRVYLARSRAMVQLTQDHAHVESLKARGLLRPNSERMRNPLLNAVGLRDDIAVDTLFVDVGRRDRLLLCTDGVHGQINSEAELAELLRLSSAEAAARALVSRVSERGLDNATAVVIEIGDRFVKRDSADRGLGSSDLDLACQSPLLSGLSNSQALAALAAAVEIELGPGEEVPRVVASDLVGYIVLDGLVSCSGDRHVSTGALIFPESLMGVWGGGELPRVEVACRLLRLRADDFQEVCDDTRLGRELYRRLAAHLARSVAAHSADLDGSSPRASRPGPV